MAFAENQLKLLEGKLLEKHVKAREQRGMTLSYVEGWHVIAEANRIFGFDGWDRETVWAERVWEDGRRDPKACAYAARVRVRVRAGETLVCRDGSGVGQGTGVTLGEAHESALKEAETDAMKRAFMTFGNLFGLALYDREQRGVRHVNKLKGLGTYLGPFIVLGVDGQALATHPTPQGFCRALKEAICTAPSAGDLEALWGLNGAVLNELKLVVPDLKTARGTHYGEVLQRHYQRQRERLKLTEPPQDPAQQSAAAAESSDADLPITSPRRLRDTDHLKYVASQPCLVCGRTPAQAHHLRFMQPRAMGSKVSDEWTVPLCVIHHRALHDVGNEVAWWEQWKVDARAAAEQFWIEQHPAKTRTVEDSAESIADGVAPRIEAAD